MATINLIGQDIERADIAPKLLKLKNCLDVRKPIWDKLTPEKKKAWITSGKDPIMNIAWDVYKYLYKFFGGAKVD